MTLVRGFMLLSLVSPALRVTAISCQCQPALTPHGWLTTRQSFHGRNCAFPHALSRVTSVNGESLVSLSMAGFGAESSSKGGRKKKKGGGRTSTNAPVKLKAKAQWDRFLGFKGVTPVTVGVRVVNRGEVDVDAEWIGVGSVRSEDGISSELSVAIQRALIAEHAKRLFPMKVQLKDQVEWGYLEPSENAEGDDGEWIVVQKEVCADAPIGVEKKMGFEGTPHPSSGYYCLYDQGRLRT